MKAHLAFGMLVLALMSPVAGSAQAPNRPGEVTVIGCLMREADYRALKKDDARGGVLSGIGQGNEYVLANAAPAPTTRRPVGTAGQQTTDYTLTGKLEDHMLRDVGRMVEVVGMATKAEKPTDMSRLTINVWHPVGDFCPAK
jgi:hypothetical protein